MTDYSSISAFRPAWLGDGRKKLLINGEAVDALSGETFNSISASTGELVAQLALAGEDDVDRAVRAARAAFEGPWSRFKPAERQAVILKLAELVDAECDDLAMLDTLEMGRPITASRGLASAVSPGRMSREFLSVSDTTSRGVPRAVWPKRPRSPARRSPRPPGERPGRTGWKNAARFSSKACM